MDIIGIKDNLRHLHFACEDLKAVKSVILAVEDDGYDGVADALKVIDRALEAIVADIEEALEEIDRCVSGKEDAHT